MGHAAVLVRRGQTEHSLPLETERATNSTARQEDFAVTRHMTRLSEHVVRVSDVLCLSAETIRSLVLDWLEAEGHDVRPSNGWVKPLLRGMCLSCKKPTKCVKELHSPARQHVLALHQAVLAHEHLWRQHRPSREHRRDLLSPPSSASDWVGPPRRQTRPAAGGVKQAQLQGNMREATFTIASSMDRGALDMLVQILHAGKTDAVLLEQSWPEHTHHVTSENGWANTTTILQLATALDDVLNPGKEGQTWIFSGTWPASTPAKAP